MRLSTKMFVIAALGLALTAGPALAQTPPASTAKPAPETQKPAAPATQKPADAAPAAQPGPEGHNYSSRPGAGVITRPMAVTSCAQRDASRTSCFLPAGVRR